MNVAPAQNLTPEPAAVQVSNLQFRWRRNGPLVLQLPDLQVARGERLMIEGPSGSGKSTLLSLLAGVITPQHGKVRVLGQDIDRMAGAARDHFRADHIGFVFQQFNLIPYLSVVENVVLPCRFSMRRRDQALRRSVTLPAEARRLLAHLELNDEHLLHRPVTELSVGQQQRVAAARALIGAPELLIADEPTSALDANRREAFVRLLFAECAENASTLIFVTHDASLEPLFDRTVRLPELARDGVPA